MRFIRHGAFIAPADPEAKAAIESFSEGEEIYSLTATNAHIAAIKDALIVIDGIRRTTDSKWEAEDMEELADRLRASKLELEQLFP